MRPTLSPLRLVLVSLLLQAGCAGTPLPFRVEHGGTLPAASYADFDAQAAAAPPRLKVFKNNPRLYPEPYWIFSFDAPFDPHQAPLQIGAFYGLGKLGSQVATNLPAELCRTLGNAHLFSSVTRSPTPHSFVLSGTVLRADDTDVPVEVDAQTQVEAIVTRDGVVLGAIQVNAIQMSFSSISILPSLLMSMAQGSRASFVSDKFAEVFAHVASGARHGIDTGSLSVRFMRTPDGGAGPGAGVPIRQADASSGR